MERLDAGRAADGVRLDAARPLWDAGVSDRYHARQRAYADADIRVDCAAIGPGEVAARVVAALQDPGRRCVEVDVGERTCPVWIEPGGFARLGAALARLPSMAGSGGGSTGPPGPTRQNPPRRPSSEPSLEGGSVVVVTDDVVGPLWADELEGALRAAGRSPRRVVLPAGEAGKTVATWARCLDGLLQPGFHRHTPVLALGGGVVGDIAGFAAACALRGVPLVQIPTTLLAMVDSSVGGKTGVNHPSGKNLVGAFHQPHLVFAALATLDTLPPAERIAGLGEVVKTALLGDAPLFALLEREAEALREGDRRLTAEVVARCVRVKADLVAADEREQGPRALLNAGHTVGHGLEAAEGFGALRHGEAVALGLVAEASWARRAGFCEEGDLPERLRALHRRLGLPVRAPQLDEGAVLAAMRLDKKSRDGYLTIPVPIRVGRMELRSLNDSRLPELLAELE